MTKKHMAAPADIAEQSYYLLSQLASKIVNHTWENTAEASYWLKSNINLIQWNKS